jgi:prepilin-type N-terminal cleavage/methylation domain-containing protein
MSRGQGTTRSAQAGFGLIELLIVLAMLGVVIGAITSVYTAHQRNASTETETIDVQQNLRVGLDQVARDISMAGFLVGGINPVSAVVNGAAGAADTMTLNTGSESLIAATINAANPAVTVAAGTLLDLPVIAYGGSIGGFEPTADEGIAKARIVNHRGEPLGAGTTFTVMQVRAAAGVCGAIAAPCIRLRADNAGTGPISGGDTIVKTSVPGGAEAFPHAVQYSIAACPAPLAGQCLMRTTVPAAAGGAVVVATNVTDLQFRYLLGGNLEVDVPTAVQIPDIRAIRVTLSGQLVDTAAVADGNLKPRTLTSIVAIRNT